MTEPVTWTMFPTRDRCYLHPGGGHPPLQWVQFSDGRTGGWYCPTCLRESHPGVLRRSPEMIAYEREIDRKINREQRSAFWRRLFRRH